MCWACATLAPDDAWHPLRVRVTPSGGRRVETRPGYFAVVAKKELIQQRLDRIAASADSLDGIPHHRRHHARSCADRRLPDSHRNPRGRRCPPVPTQEGRAVEQLIFVTLLKDASGVYVTGRQAVMALALPRRG